MIVDKSKLSQDAITIVDRIIDMVNGEYAGAAVSALMAVLIRTLIDCLTDLDKATKLVIEEITAGTKDKAAAKRLQ
jgi:hypothetical protein